TITFTATPSSQTVLSWGFFDVTLQLTTTGTTTPPSIGGFDTIFEAPTIQNGTSISGNFAIINAVSNILGWQSNTGTGYPDVLTIGSSDHAGFVQNQSDQGFFEQLTSQTQGVPALNLPLATYSFSVAPGTPAGIYTFSTTAGAYINLSDLPSPRFSRVADENGVTYRIDEPATFSIEIAPVAIPEPGTWLLLGMGGVGSLGLRLLRARRNAKSKA